jgi:hypothetical protein
MKDHPDIAADVAAYLARGGRIEQVPFGVATERDTGKRRTRQQVIEQERQRSTRARQVAYDSKRGGR